MKRIIAILLVMTSLKSSGQVKHKISIIDILPLKSAPFHEQDSLPTPMMINIGDFCGDIVDIDFFNPVVPAPRSRTLVGEKFPYDDIRNLMATLPGIYQQRRGDDVHISGNR